MNNTAEQIEDFLTVPSNKTNRLGLTFSSIEELKLWLNQEVESWQWINDISAVKNAFINTNNLQYTPLMEARRHLLQTKEMQDANSINTMKQQVQGHLNQWLNHNFAITSDSPEGKFIFKIRQNESPDEAAYVLQSFMEEYNEGLKIQRITQWNYHQLTSALRVILYRLNIVESAEANFSTLLEISNKIANIHREAVRRNLELTNLLESANTTLQATTNNFETSLNQTKISFEEALKDLEQAYHDKLETNEKAFKERMSLEAPVTYWSKRSFNSNVLTIIFGFLSSVMVILTLCFCYNMSTNTATVFNFISSLDNKFLDSNFIQKIVIGALVVTIVLFLWVIKILVKIMFTNLHSAIDAKERSIMISTYLSLIKSNEDRLPDDAKRIILEALFRPSSVANVKDDNWPHPIIELLNRK